MTSTAALRLSQTERTISFTLTLPRLRISPVPRAKRAAAPTAGRPYRLNEAAFFIQRPLI